jgi:Lon protease-like protein
MGESEEVAIRVNFGRAMPMFPLASVSLMPHAMLPLHIFEARYRQMITRALDGPGQIAMAVYDDTQPPDEFARPALRGALCVGQIVEHQQLPDGRYTLLLHGICRARLLHELPPDEDRLYREAYLEPVGLEQIEEEEMAEHKERLYQLLSAGPLTDFTDAKALAGHLQDKEIPTSAVLEVVTCSALLTDPELRYRLLAEASVLKRAELVERELEKLAHLLDRAGPQRRTDAPKGVYYN